MSTAARAKTAGPSVGGDAGGVAGRGDVAGRLLGRLSVLPVLVVMAWLLAGLPLLLAGRFTAVAMLAVSVPLAVVLLAAGLRWIPHTPRFCGQASKSFTLLIRGRLCRDRLIN